MGLGTNDPHILLIEKKVGAPEKNPRWPSNPRWPPHFFVNSILFLNDS